MNMNTANIKMIVTDLDGTLLKNDKQISSRTKSVINQLQNRNILFVIATARPIRAVKVFLPWVNYDAAIFHNGAVVMDGELLCAKRGIKSPKQVVLTILKNNPHCNIAVESNDVMYSNFDAGVIWPGIDYIETSDFNELKSSFAEKIIIDAHSIEEMHTLKNYLTEDLYMILSENRIITIHNIHTSKINGIKILAKRYGITLDQIVAFGDDYNDIEMLKSCGIGIAVENALPEVKEAANQITGCNEEDGVAAWIEHFLL